MKLEDIEEVECRSYVYHDDEDNFYRDNGLPLTEMCVAFTKDTEKYGAEIVSDHVDKTDWILVNGDEYPHGRYRILVLNNYLAIME